MNKTKRKEKKIRIRNNRLFIQICACFGFVLVLFALIIGMMFSKLYEDNMLKTYRKQMKKQARHIAKEMSGFVAADDTEGSFNYLDYLDSMENSENTDIWFIDNDEDNITLKKEFTNVDIVDIKLSNEVRYVLAQAKKGKVSYACGYDAIYEKTMMCVAAPIRDGKKRVVGIVLLNSFVEQRDTFIRTSRQYIEYSILVGIGTCLVIGFILAMFITRPLSRMRQVALELADGHYEKRTNVKGKNEIGVLARSMDILAERLEQNEKERQEAEQMRLDFFANVSHELRTPITVMRGYSESLADGVVKAEKQQQYYQRMVSECQSMERLVGDLLTLSKMQNPHFVVEKEPVNLAQIFYDILRGYKAIAEKKQIQLLFSCQEEIVMMLGDYDRLRQLFTNIIDNAIKFSREGGRVWITITKKDKIEVSIRDEGVGISEEELPNIFDKFYKSKLRQNAKGSGLGLVIAKSIVEKHEGTIEVDSKPGEGTEFRFYFALYTGAWES